MCDDHFECLAIVNSLVSGKHHYIVYDIVDYIIDACYDCQVAFASIICVHRQE